MTDASMGDTGSFLGIMLCDRTLLQSLRRASHFLGRLLPVHEPYLVQVLHSDSAPGLAVRSGADHRPAGRTGRGGRRGHDNSPCASSDLGNDPLQGTGTLRRRADQRGIEPKSRYPARNLKARRPPIPLAVPRPNGPSDHSLIR